MLQKLVAVVGPTATGKTALSVRLAKRFCAEVVSFDSMQIYRGLSIASAKPTEEEMGGVPHHMFDICDTDEAFSVADYVSMAQREVQDISARGALPILCGGTGLYLDSFLRGEEALKNTEGDPQLRAALTEEFEKNGIAPLYERLRRQDPQAAEKIHPNNTRRVIRALEICESTGMKKSEWDARSRAAGQRYAVCKVGIAYRDRTLLWRRIEQRVDAMLRAGLWQEILTLYESGRLPEDATAAQAIGCKEIIRCIGRGEPPEKARQDIIIATRQYAKRQMTWFRRDGATHWLYADAFPCTQALWEAAEKIVSAFLKEDGNGK